MLLHCFAGYTFAELMPVCLKVSQCIRLHEFEMSMQHPVSRVTCEMRSLVLDLEVGGVLTNFVFWFWHVAGSTYMCGLESRCTFGCAYRNDQAHVSSRRSRWTR